ncbi:undecaprenyl-diphosphate phosphatase [Deinococcus cellulosilyticus]|uniref:Undecaprenyl-diphosphatase n=1 Tax=Deinococcus cellulosilyticus (strain DSM 18568 / NBRC 106333 / KACC 11606 / 5516J-15) TaxID=1223518 RepID=A0A511N1D8_DEIC1|nr:undecaprenyl-diphosphate phosphatase [Deinococcus cellulosilyticus]GEM46695.1 undecaprenyl-diphosphatase [Deinococcus cellulosilyticus NBRC 106333 = KACC 11606]
MLNSVNLLIVGVVEGITEFLPISSTGHLIVTADLMHFKSSKLFEILIQLGGVLAVLVFYSKDLLGQARHITTSRDTQRFWLTILVAALPAGVLALLLKNTIEAHFFNATVVAVSLIIGGVVMLVVERLPHRQTTHEATKVTLRQAVTVGLFQVFPLIPGVSRSASTIVGGLLSGMGRSAATGFSFYLSIPVLGAASLLSLVKDLQGTGPQEATTIFVGLGVAFGVALLSIGWFLKFIARHNFQGFALYRIFAGAAILLLVHSGSSPTHRDEAQGHPRKPGMWAEVPDDGERFPGCVSGSPWMPQPDCDTTRTGFTLFDAPQKDRV